MLIFIISIGILMGYIIYRLFRMKKGMDKSINNYVLYKRKTEFDKINENIKREEGFDLVDFENEVIEDLENRGFSISELIELQEQYRDSEILEKAFLKYKKIQDKKPGLKNEEILFYIKKIRDILKTYYKRDL